MANICIESFWTFLFELLKYSLDNIVFVLLTLIIVAAIARKMGPLVLGLIAAAADFLIDLVTTGTLGLSFFLTILVGLAIGVIWAMMIFSSSVSILIKIPNAILMFFFGLLLAIAPAPYIAPLSAIVGFLLQNFRIVNYLIGIISLFFIYFVLSVSISLISGFCQGLQYALNLF